jgi:hypothetical protein
MLVTFVVLVLIAIPIFIIVGLVVNNLRFRVAMRRFLATLLLGLSPLLVSTPKAPHLEEELQEPKGSSSEERQSPPAKASSREELWRWLALTVGGTVLPFGVLGLAYWLVAGHTLSLQAVLGRGELFIPASIMNAEAIWILSHAPLPGRSVWFPIIFATCGLAALGGAICYGITAALDSAPHNRVDVTQATLSQLARNATVLSAGEFLLALLVGTIGVALFILVRGQEVSAHE